MVDERFQVGDIVSRDGSDLQRVLDVNPAGDLIDVECVRAPGGLWCQVGDRENNLAARYRLVGRGIAYALFTEKSDQMGTVELAAVYSSRDLAEIAKSSLISRRSFISTIPLDPTWRL